MTTNTTGSLQQPALDRDCMDHDMDQASGAAGLGLPFSDTTYSQIAATFRALADATRVKIVYSLMRRELCTCHLAALLGVSESVVSQHLRVLRQLRLIKSRRSGKQVFHTLDDAHIDILLSVCLNHVHDAERRHEGMDRIVALLPTDTDLVSA